MISLSTRGAALTATALTGIGAIVTASVLALAPAVAAPGDRADLVPSSDDAPAMYQADAAEVEALHADVDAASASAAEASGLLGNSATTFVPVAPCRIADTRLGGGKIGSQVLRNFHVTGTAGFSGQGGVAGGCGIPENAVAIAAGLKAVAPTGSGYLRAWGYGEAQPPSTALTFAKGVDIGDATVLPLGLPDQAYDISTKPYKGSIHLLIDVTGYYVLNDHGLLLADGSLDSGGATLWNVEKTGTGAYELVVDHDIWFCSYSVTPFDANLVASASYSAEWINAFDVQLRQPDGTPVDGDFYYSITC
ncbi:hypothetical protein [Agromyces sp. SYSU T0242]|uniref:hypothetical protein n=1 Tax=Agromyces litoreus TaxID=3158561 RepID=UPI0033968FB8